MCMGGIDKGLKEESKGNTLRSHATQTTLTLALAERFF
jgi:hypothetical protein